LYISFRNRILPYGYITTQINEIKQSLHTFLRYFFVAARFYDKRTVIPMYNIMPMMSLVMEIKGPVAIAGSILSFSNVMGTNVPKIDANITTANKLIETE